MKTTAKIVMVVLIGLVFVASGAFAAEPKYSGFLGDYYKNLQPGPKDGAKMRWLKPGVDFTKYNKLMVDSVIFYLADDSEDKGINAEEVKELTDTFNQEIVNALKDKYPIVAEPGPDVARLRIAITGVKKSKPGMSVVSSIVPVGIGISLIKKGVTGSYSGSGGTNAEFMALDSMSNDVIIAAVDERSAGYTERFTSLGAAKDAFKFWAQRIRKFMDETGGAKQ
ncbi:MAG: hypothetical protein A4E65_02209 [Syntrophorhabdus sp. PtaU1.Bin153]|nr:MAG: hypothetical protein A4E65_02209 [Syntrophorhabdus sp. PtaU1.Bin153]